MFDNLFISGSFEYELQNFSASLSLDKTVTLQWATILESNVQRYSIERSWGNLNSFVKIDSVSAINQGKFTQTYHRTDGLPGAGLIFYRLRMTTSDGILRYSAPVNVWISDNAAPVVYPNPTDCAPSVNITQGDVSDPVKFVNIYAASGQTVARITTTTTTGINSIAVNALPNGLYFLEIITEKTVYRTRLVVRN